MKADVRPLINTVLAWAWDAFRGILKGMVTSAVELAWRLFVVTSLAIVGVSYASESPPESPFDIPGEVIAGLGEIVAGMRVLVQAAERYMAS